MGPQPNATHPNEREPGARERESERLFLATMPSSSLPGSQRPRERRRTCPLSSSAQGGSRGVHPTCPGAFGCPQERTVPMLSAAEWGWGPQQCTFPASLHLWDHEPWCEETAQQNDLDVKSSGSLGCFLPTCRGRSEAEKLDGESEKGV